MRVQEVKRQILVQEWAEQINERKQSGLTVKQWCNENGIHIKTYYNRMKRVREEFLDNMDTESALQVSRHGRWSPGQLNAPVFATMPMPQRGGVAVTVHIGTHNAEIHNGADPETAESVLRALTRL